MRACVSVFIVKLQMCNQINFVFSFTESCVWLNQLDWISSTDPANCPKNCGKMYKGPYRKRHLRQHLVYECGVLPKFQCTLCSKRFARNPQLKYHLIRIHKIIV